MQDPGDEGLVKSDLSIAVSLHLLAQVADFIQLSLAAAVEFGSLQGPGDLPGLRGGREVDLPRPALTGCVLRVHGSFL
jgi:hypothetical protein